jgi:predicted RNA methylase
MRPIVAKIVSACAGQGHDLIGVLAQRTDADRVDATLIESDPRNVRAARAVATAARLANVEVRQADAGDLTSYRDAGLPT